MGPRLDPIKAKGKLIKVGFNITDLNETYGVVIRNQIAEVSNSYKDDYDVIVSVDSDTWKGIILKQKVLPELSHQANLKLMENQSNFFNSPHFC